MKISVVFVKPIDTVPLKKKRECFSESTSNTYVGLYVKFQYSTSTVSRAKKEKKLST